MGRLSAKQREALRLIGQTHPEVDALVTSDATFWDSEIDAAYVHRSTAWSLRWLGLVQFERVPDADADRLAIRLTNTGRDLVEAMG